MNMKSISELAQHAYEAANDHAECLNEPRGPDWDTPEATTIRDCFTAGIEPVLTIADDEWRTALATVLDETKDSNAGLRDKLVALIENERATL